MKAYKRWENAKLVLCCIRKPSPLLLFFFLLSSSGPSSTWLIYVIYYFRSLCEVARISSSSTFFQNFWTFDLWDVYKSRWYYIKGRMQDANSFHCSFIRPISYICIDVIQSRRRPNKLLHLLCNTLFSAFWCFSSFTTVFEKYELFLLNSKRSLVLVHFEEKREPFPLYCQFLTYVVSMLSSPFLKTILGTILDVMQWKKICGIQKLFCFHQNTGKWSLGIIRVGPILKKGTSGFKYNDQPGIRPK